MCLRWGIYLKSVYLYSMIAVVDQHIPYIEGVLEPHFGEVRYLPADGITRQAVADARALLVRTRTHCDARLLDGSAIEFIGSATIGSDHIDTAYCQQRGIRVDTAPGCNAVAVQQWTLAAMVHWVEHNRLSLRGLTLGVVGVGHVGSRVEAGAKMLGMSVLRCDPPRQRVEVGANFVALPELLQRADIVTFHVPLVRTGADATQHLLHAGNIGLCKHNALIINSSRGGVVETDALLNFAFSHPEAALALDVWEGEPHPNAQLVERCLIATPHIAGYSIEGKRSATRMLLNALSRHFALPHIALPLTADSPPEHLAPCATLAEAIAATYPIASNDLRCIGRPFEDYRNAYPYRHDFGGFAANLRSSCYADLLRMGFSPAQH